MVELAKYFYYNYESEIESANHYFDTENALFKAVEILGPVTNLISCMILALVIRFIYKLSKRVETGKETAAVASKLNALVTGSHIGVTLVYTVVQFIILFRKN